MAVLHDTVYIFSLGMSAYDNWQYCVNYTTVGSVDVDVIANCTTESQITITSLENDTLYRFTVSASGPGGERVTPDVFVFRTKLFGKMYTCTFSNTSYIYTYMCNILVYIIYIHCMYVQPGAYNPPDGRLINNIHSMCPLLGIDI